MNIPRVSLFGIDILCVDRKFLVYNMVARNLIIKYRRSIFGLLWTLLAPLGTCVVYFVVFKQIVNIKIPHYLVYILSGILPWTFFVQSLIEGTESIHGNMSLVSKIPMPLQIFPFVGTVTNFFTLLMSLPILVLASLISDAPLQWMWLMLIPYMLILFMITYSLSWILSIAFIYLRDLKHAISLILQVLFYATPIIYSDVMIPAHLRIFLYLNPVSFVFIGIRRALLENEFLRPQESLCMFSWLILLLISSTLIHRKWSGDVVEML